MLQRTAFGIIASVLSLSAVYAEPAGPNCPAFPEGTVLSDGQLFYQNEVSDSVHELSPLGQLPEALPRPVRFFYIVKELFDDRRAGVIVIKSGRRLGFDEKDEPLSKKLVQLSRSKHALPNNEACDTPKQFKGSARAQTYDNYHDYGYEPRSKQEYEGDFATLMNFHLRKYLARNKSCHDTTRATPDAFFKWDFRNNLSQFSFDQGVVAFGLRSQTWRAIRGTTESGSTGLADQRVKIKQYQTGPAKIACVPFKLFTTGPNFFLRINDLESGYIRKPEHSWRLTP